MLSRSSSISPFLSLSRSIQCLRAHSLLYSFVVTFVSSSTLRWKAMRRVETLTISSPKADLIAIKPIGREGQRRVQRVSRAPQPGIANSTGITTQSQHNLHCMRKAFHFAFRRAAPSDARARRARTAQRAQHACASPSLAAAAPLPPPPHGHHLRNLQLHCASGRCRVEGGGG